jgi:predicted enzyme involved in methoxymalonyl-ACP biosynthesis
VAAEGALDIDSWLMSCRVLGGRVEDAVLAELLASRR